jgi:hypothetical protein
VFCCSATLPLHHLLKASLTISSLEKKTINSFPGNAVVAESAKLTGIAAALGVEEADLNRVLTTKTFSAR